MAIEQLKAVSNYPSGNIPPGASVNVSVHGPTGRDSAPDTGYEWKLKYNGAPLNAAQLSALCTVQVPHTWDRRDFGFKLKPDVAGSFDLSLRGHDPSTAQLSERWSWTIAESSPAQEVFGGNVATKQDLAELEKRLKDYMSGLFK